MLKFFAPPPHIESLPQEKIDGAYKKYRIQQFASIYLGYAAYYLIRKNFAIASPYFINELGFSKAQIGFIASGLGIAYGLSKFIMGNISDRCNPRFFLATGLILSALVNICFGLTSSITLLFLLMILNGWFQGMGWPPCGRILAHWYSNKERGTKMAWWNTAHNVGGGLIAPLATFGIATFSGWKFGIFYFPAIICLAIAIFILLFTRDTPQSVGLPAIEEYMNDYPEDIDKDSIKDNERELSAKEILFNYVLNNKYVWAIAIANIFVYLVRYGVMDWVPTYLTEVKGFNPEDSRLAFFFFEFAAIPGTIIVGWISDKVFKGRRAPVGIFCMIGVAFAVLAYWLSTSPLLINIAVASIGALIYGPVMLIGVAALDYVPKKAAGTAAGFTGLFGYLGGSVLANFAIGLIVDKVGWNGGFIFLLASCILAIVFLAFTWNTNSDNARNKNKKFA
ncbi:glycerol-3-phosphate transporter [Tepidibacter formicigenes]|jgi:OPA family glycerol-3-phosphate transporter-like MFS transporter|uniref:Glycerol-3-phosphate transporter n=1 Tax=Tepidibacter formicigenes DSM 15518 TaxID=1123349 RepID=A0A1M6PF55_9FIRM|nr:glycerol-3-phosphate transporter [Tepidibacter formicigenes]SHK06576.1 MFS transporter, OPA family, glycerol-3-phosphate transporter [Tepidibacter formicigenes DSM 15518]